MTDDFISSDVAVLDLLRKREQLTVTELARMMDVTATAVRQRLVRLMAQDLVGRAAIRRGRGRPRHVYRLTDKGRRKTGANFADLAIALWQEIRAIKDPQVRQGLIQRISKRLAIAYADYVYGETDAERMESVARLFDDRQVPFCVDREEGLPVLTALACPYPALAEQDRTICAMERLLFSELLGRNVHLSQCRLDGESCCTFELN